MPASRLCRSFRWPRAPLYNVASINSKHLERICEYLNREPNDLYEWRPSQNTLNTENHPLKALRREQNAAEFSKLVAEIPLDKIEQVKEILSGLKNNE